jgi:hypothetical protein
MLFTVQPLKFSQAKSVLAVNRTLRRLSHDSHITTQDLRSCEQVSGPEAVATGTPLS